MLWDTRTREVVNNESADIIEILNSAFDDFAPDDAPDLAPPDLRPSMDSWNDLIYHNLNNGVYRSGFAQSQEAYEDAVRDVFDTLDRLDAHLATSRYLCGGRVTLADVRLFTTLFRFDAIYHGLFKCSQRKVAEYDHLPGYLRDMYQASACTFHHPPLPGVAATCDLDANLAGYYGTLFPLNPGGIIPLAPTVSTHDSLTAPHNRAMLSSVLVAA
eukprot:SM000175S03310  [mRNA]  locus=s175:295235:296218:+ [translate_table: standard]